MQLPGKLPEAIEAIPCAFNESNTTINDNVEASYPILFPIHGISVSQFKENRCGVLSFSCLVTTLVSCRNQHFLPSFVQY